jgi:CRISP-associated protein Cas1
MINELVYCPRLFYFMHVEGQFAHNADTADGISKHRRVDTEPDALPTPDDPSHSPDFAPHAATRKPPAVSNIKQLSLLDDSDSTDTSAAEEPSTDPLSLHPLIETPLQVVAVPLDFIVEPAADPIHARSVTLASDRLGVLAKLDLVEARGSLATPVDYKRGEPRRGADGMPEAWDCDRVQVCLQALVLRENGFQCDEGVLYFAWTRQRVTTPFRVQLNAVSLKP